LRGRVSCHKKRDERETKKKKKKKEPLLAHLLGSIELHALAGEVGAGLLELSLELGRRDVGVTMYNPMTTNESGEAAVSQVI